MLLIYFGNIPLQETFGPFAEGNLKNVPIMLKIFSLFRWLLNKLSRQKLENWAVTAWAIWNARNKFYFEHIQTHPKVILDGAIGFLQEYRPYQRLVATQ